MRIAFAYKIKPGASNGPGKFKEQVTIFRNGNKFFQNNFLQKLS